MPGKRANENAQMRREEYDAMEAAGGGDDSQIVTRGITRAPEEQLKKRRIVRASRPTARVPSAHDADTDPNPFAGLKSKVGDGGNKKPSFSFAINGSQPAPAAAVLTTKPFTFNSGEKTATHGQKRTPNKHEIRARALEQKLRERMEGVQGKYKGSRLDETILRAYMKTAALQIEEWANENPERAGRTAKPDDDKPDGKPTGLMPPSAPTPAPSMGGSNFSAPPPATGAFTFGAKGDAPAPATTTGFGFGGASSVSAPAPEFSSGASSAPAPTGTSTLSSFSFGADAYSGSAAPVPPAGSFSLDNSTQEANKAASAATTPGFSFPDNSKSSTAGDGDENGPVPADDDAPPVEEEADEGWDELLALGPVIVYRQDSPEEWANIAKGRLRLQRMQEKPTKCRVLMRDEAGLRVLLNVTIASNAVLQEQMITNKKKEEVGIITFSAVNDEDVGLQLFRIKSKKRQHDELFAKMQEMKGYAGGN